MNSVNCIIYTSLKLKNSQQYKEQTIHNFTSYLNELNDDLSEMTHEEQRV